MTDIRIVPNQSYCLFCGEPFKQGWDDGDTYYYCNCDDYLTNKSISEEIDKLELSRPARRYAIQQRLCLVKDNNLWL